MADEQEESTLPEVRNWALRPRRNLKPVKTYWEEFVETDEWYKEKLCEDIPDDEIMAAFFDEEFSNDAGEEGEEDEEEEGEEDEEDDPDFLMNEAEDAAESEAESESGSEGASASEADELSGDGLDCTDSECESESGGEEEAGV